MKYKLKSLSKREQTFILIIVGLAGFAFLTAYFNSIQLNGYINSLNNEKTQLEKLRELEPNNRVWQSQLNFVNAQLETLKQTR